jgi:branched-chain amino acid transport system substrate-binding protein
MKRRTTVAIGIVAAIALGASACSKKDDKSSDSTNSTTTAASEAAGNARGNVDGVLKIGTLVPQTGDLSAIAKSLSTPIELAVKEINDAGGVNGKPVELIPGDDGTSAGVAETTYGKEVNTDKVDIILGPAPSSVAAKLTDKFAADKLPVCSGSTTAASLTGQGGGYFFRTAPPDSLQGPALAQLILGDGHTKVGILARNDDYGKGFSEALAGGLKNGGASVTTTVLYDPNGSSFDGDVQKIADSKPDAVAVIGFNDDGAKIINTMIGKNLGPSKLPTYTGDGMQSSKFGASVDPANPGKVAGIKGTAPAASPAGIESPFQAAFKATGVDPIFSSYFYDCTVLMALASQAAKSDDGAKIKDAFAKNLEGDTDCKTYKECLDALKAGKSIHYRGASSTFDKWNKTEPGTGAYEVWSYGPDGKTVTEPADKQIKIS